MSKTNYSVIKILCCSVCLKKASFIIDFSIDIDDFCKYVLGKDVWICELCGCERVVITIPTYSTEIEELDNVLQKRRGLRKKFKR